MINLKEWMMILELHQQGLTVSAIAERTGHDRKTVRKVISRLDRAEVRTAHTAADAARPLRDLHVPGSG